MTSTLHFCQIIRQRSQEHTRAGDLLFNNQLYGQFISVLRQELDSLVRTVYLLSLDLDKRHQYFNQTLKNQQWTLPNSRARITDRHMVDFSIRLFGWTQSVYKVGCAFIHLSPFADYNNSNPFLLLDEMERGDIKQHLHNYHGFNLSNELNMATITPFLPAVLKKISGNLECYVGKIESGNPIRTSDI